MDNTDFNNSLMSKPQEKIDALFESVERPNALSRNFLSVDNYGRLNELAAEVWQGRLPKVAVGEINTEIGSEISIIRTARTESGQIYSENINLDDLWQSIKGSEIDNMRVADIGLIGGVLIAEIIITSSDPNQNLVIAHYNPPNKNEESGVTALIREIRQVNLHLAEEKTPTPQKFEVFLGRKSTSLNQKAKDERIKGLEARKSFLEKFQDLPKIKPFTELLLRELLTLEAIIGDKVGYVLMEASGNMHNKIKEWLVTVQDTISPEQVVEVNNRVLVRLTDFMAICKANNPHLNQ